MHFMHMHVYRKAYKMLLYDNATADSLARHLPFSLRSVEVLSVPSLQECIPWCSAKDP